MAQRQLNRYRLDQLEAIRKDSNLTRLSAGLRRTNATSKKLAAVLRAAEKQIIKDSMMPEAVAAAAEVENLINKDSEATKRMDEHNHEWLTNRAHAAAEAAKNAQRKREWCLNKAAAAVDPLRKKFFMQKAERAAADYDEQCRIEKIVRQSATPDEAIERLKQSGLK